MSKGIIDQKGKKLIGPGKKKSISGWVNVGGSIHQQTATHSLCHSTVYSYTPVAHTNTHTQACTCMLAHTHILVLISLLGLS